jgi:hypothetical protein
MLRAGVHFIGRTRPRGSIVTKRSVASVIILSIVTIGIYMIVWNVKTKREMVTAGADIPTSWLMIVPIANIYWMWKFAGGVEHVTGGKLSQAVSFLLMVIGNGVIPLLGTAVIQAELNKAIDRGVPGQLPMARVA